MGVVVPAHPKAIARRRGQGLGGGKLSGATWHMGVALPRAVVETVATAHTPPNNVRGRPMRDEGIQTEVKLYLGYLLRNGNTLDSLPINHTMAEGILAGTVEARKVDLAVLRQAYLAQGLERLTGNDPVVEF